MAGALFVALAIASRRETPLPGDVRATQWLQGWQGDVPAGIAGFGNGLGSAPVIVAIAALIAVGFAFGRCWFETGFMLAATAAKALNGVLKTIVDAPRPAPDLVRVTEHASGSGYPSGHVMGVALVLGAAALMTGRRSARFRGPVWAVASLGVLVTAFGRVSVGAHWPSQTLGGLLAAIALFGIMSFLGGFSDQLRSP